jgi:hypothetical protein
VKRPLREVVGSRLEGLTPVRRELRALREAHERLREELASQQERAEQLEQKHREEVRRLEGARDKYRVERDQVTQQLTSVQESQSFKVGHAIVRVARFPLVAVRALVRLARRIVRGLLNRVIRPSARGVARAVRAVASFLGSLPSRLARLAKRSGRAAKARIPKPKPAPKPSAAKPAAAGASKADEDRVISVPQGNDFLGPLTDGHATTMFLLWGLSDEEIDSLVDEVARLQLMQWDFKPLFVTDSDHWGSFQEHGYWFEFVPPSEDWISHNSGGDWMQFVSERIDSIIETYSPDRIVVYEDASKRGALRRGVLNGVISAGEPVVEMTTTAKLQQPGNGASAQHQPATPSSGN